jgi:hypothetical protein
MDNKSSFSLKKLNKMNKPLKIRVNHHLHPLTLLHLKKKSRHNPDKKNKVNINMYIINIEKGKLF